MFGNLDESAAALLQKVQDCVNEELDRQYGQLRHSLRDFFYDLFNYELERPWRESLDIFAEYWVDRGLRLTPRTLNAIAQLIAEELDDAEDGVDADDIAVPLAEAGPTAGVDDETEPAERATAGEQSKGQVESDADDASRATSEARYNREQQPAAAIGSQINEDPIGFAAGDANLYRDVENGPTNATDLTGLFAPRAEPGKFSIYVLPDPFNAKALNSDIDVKYNVTVSDKIKYSRIELIVYARTIARNFLWGGFPGSAIDPIGHGQEQWHRDDPVPGQLTGSYPTSRTGPFWTDNPGSNLNRFFNISFYQEWEGQAWGLSKSDGKWHLIKKARWGHKATLSGGQYKIERWPPPP